MRRSMEQIEQTRYALLSLCGIFVYASIIVVGVYLLGALK